MDILIFFAALAVLVLLVWSVDEITRYLERRNINANKKNHRRPT